MTGPRSARRLAVTLRHDKYLAAAVAVLLAFVALALAAPWLTGQDPTAVDYAQAQLPPGLAHPLGTDNFGRDVLARLMYGGRASLTAAAAAVSVIVVVGGVIGAVAGYLGGVVDLVATRVIDVLLAFPRLVLAIAVAALWNAGLAGLVVALSLVSWPSYARMVRGLVLQVCQEGYVIAARAAGTGWLRILRGHVLGATAGFVLVLALVDFGEIVLGVAALSFLGLGIQQPTPEWGAMLNEARPYAEDAPWSFLAPGVAIFLVVLAANYLGDAVRDALNPRPVPLLAPARLGDLPRRGRPAGREAGGRVARTVTSSPAPLVVRGLSVGVPNGPEILRDVSLSVGPGECVGLVGRSGSGKSTFALALLGLLRDPLEPRSGDIRLLGESTAGWTWQDWRPVRGRHIAYIGQDPLNALNPLLRVGAQVAECGTAHGLSAARAVERAREVLHLVRLPGGVARQYPHQLSGGMRQRVVIAMALVHRPRLLVADEPTTALDVSTQAGIMSELARLRAELGIALLFVSHDLRVVASVADRVAVLHEGRIVEQATTRELFISPRDPRSRELVAAIPRPAGVPGAEVVDADS